MRRRDKRIIKEEWMNVSVFHKVILELKLINLFQRKMLLIEESD